MFHHGWYTPPTGFASSARTPPPVLASEPLMRSWEATGSFWRPETPDKVFWGTIAFNPGEGAKLVLTGNFLGNNSPRLRDEVPVLHGRLFNGDPCSLFSCWCNVEFYVTDREHFRTQAFSHLSIFGGHWSEVDACRFDQLQVRFSNLDQWLDNPYDIRHKRDFTRSLLTFKPDKLDADFVFQDVPVHLESGCGRSVPFEATPEGARWPYQYHLILKPESSQPIDWLLELTSVLREFFVFLIGSGVYTLDLVGISGSMETKNLRECQVNHPVTVPAVVRTDSRYFSTRHRDYKESLPSIMRTWFERRDELEIAAKAYTELLCTDGMSPEAIFLRTIQTLEHFYGALWPEESRYIEKSIFRKFSKWLGNNFLNSQEDFSPKEILTLESHKSDLLERIGNINRLSLRDKLQRIFYETPTNFILSEKVLSALKSKNAPNDIIENLEGIKGQEINGRKDFLDLLDNTIGEEYTVKYQSLILENVEIFGILLMPILGNPRNMNEALREFFVRLIPTRNYLTHFSQDVTQKVFQGDELENAAVVCWGVLTFWIARHLGTDEDHAVDMALAAKNAMFLVSLQHRL